MKNCSWLNIPPAKTCIFCGKDFNEIGGHRIIADNDRGFGFSDYIEKGTNKTELIRYHGEQWFLTKEMIEKSIEVCSQNQRPWFCSKCGLKTCEICSEPKFSADDFHYINEQGQLLNAPKLETNASCNTPLCKNFIGIS